MWATEVGDAPECGPVPLNRRTNCYEYPFEGVTSKAVVKTAPFKASLPF